MLVLGIESTCDETACAIVEDGKHILSNIVSSQAELHEIYGGVVPELSCRHHVETIIPCIQKALQEAGKELKDIDLIAVSYAPGLVGALLIGLNTAKTLSLALNIPFVGVNHVEAHLYAAIMSSNTTPQLPCLGVVISGGHTALWKVSALGNYELIGQTLDDALGEAFDKVSKMLHLPYPGGPLIEQLAKQGDKHAYKFKAGKVKGQPLNFSFSGLKTAVLYALNPQNGKKVVQTEEVKRNIAASFQEVALNDIVEKVQQAAEQIGVRDIVLGGGVVNNFHLRNLFEQKTPHLRCFWPSKSLSLDNAAMIAGLGYHVFERKGRVGDPYDLECQTRLNI